MDAQCALSSCGLKIMCWHLFVLFWGNYSLIAQLMLTAMTYFIACRRCDYWDTHYQGKNQQWKTLDFQYCASTRWHCVKGFYLWSFTQFDWICQNQESFTNFVLTNTCTSCHFLYIWEWIFSKPIMACPYN